MSSGKIKVYHKYSFHNKIIESIFKSQGLVEADKEN